MDLKNRKIRSQLRRNIGRWLKNEGATDRRGDPLIPQNELSKFKEIAIEIIRNMESRKLDDFRKEILPYLKKIREENGLKFADNMLQKHKWSKFLHQHKDIKEVWDQLPRLKERKNKFEKICREKIENISQGSTDFASGYNMNSIEESEFFKDEMIKEEDEEFSQINIKIDPFENPEEYFEIKREEVDLFNSSLVIKPRLSNYLGLDKKQNFINEMQSSMSVQPGFDSDLKIEEKKEEDYTGGTFRGWQQKPLTYTDFQNLFANWESNYF